VLSVCGKLCGGPRSGDRMVGDLSSWSMDTVTQPAQDVGYGWRILSAADKPRMITSLSVYSGTNSAAATIRYFVVPSQPPSVGLAGGYDMTETGGIYGVQCFHNTGNLSSGTSPETGFGLATDRGGGLYIMLPPQYMLIACIADANTGGTLIHSVVSADVG